MIIVTGGAGFIGSALIWKLNQLGEANILVVDHLAASEKWKNLRRLRFTDYLEKGDFLQNVRCGVFNQAAIRCIFHLGACSSTTEGNASYLIENNYRYTKELAEFAVSRGIRFIYASSAATYGSGDKGYNDVEEQLGQLTPLNMYGYSKQLVDLWALRKGCIKRIVGLKYFNVFGPNEYHKGDMRSMVLKAYEQIKKTGKVSLFKSHMPQYADGEQKRDFLYVKDAVDMTLFFYQNPEVNGIFNIGSGVASTWKQLMESLFAAMGLKPNITYIDMPESIRNQYQYFTRAEMGKICKAGYGKPAMELADAVKDYAEYLKTDSYLG